MKRIGFKVLGVMLAFSSNAFADEPLSISVNKVTPQGIGESMGTLTLSDSAQGLRLVPSVKGLTPGPHGMHVHENPSCAPGLKDGVAIAAGAAGGHLDPVKSGKHLGPSGTGHKGDLPLINADKNGVAHDEVIAPQLKVADVIDHSIVIHGGGDNYSDSPAPLGGGGPRVACAVIESKR